MLVEVFQVNCPGCFLYSLPQAIDLYLKYSHQGLVVLGIATAFEDFNHNNLTNLTRLVEKGEVIGETQRLLSQQGQLQDNRLPYRIPFAVAMDHLNRRVNEVTEEEITTFIDEHFPNFPQLSVSQQGTHIQQVQQYLKSLEYHAETFEAFNLKGTPSSILVDKSGILRNCDFGASPDLEAKIQELL